MKYLNLNYNFTHSNNNVIYDDYNFYFYKFNKLNRKLLIKNNNNNFFKKKSTIRDKNIVILQKYFNNSICDGKKEFFFKNFNIFINLFFFIFLKNDVSFQNLKNYKNTFDFINSKIMHFDFIFLIKDFIYEYNSIFNIKISKVPKKYKLKFKKNFIFELVYVYRIKRLKFTLKLLNAQVKKNTSYNLNKKLFWTFLDIILDYKNFFLWKRKIHIYNKAMQKFFKKH